MYGLAAINMAHGWVITIAGIAIVFSGLVILSSFIANLQRLLTLWDNRREFIPIGRPKRVAVETSVPTKAVTAQEEAATCGATTVTLTAKELEVANYFQLITQRLGEPFSLPLLLEKAEKRGIANPHRHLDTFLKLQLIVEGQDDLRGFYQWRKDIRIISSESGQV